MKTEKRYLLGLVLTLVFMSLIQTTASASIWVCWNGDPCFETEGTCDGWCPGSNGQPTCSECGIATFNPNTDYILTTTSGEAWIIQGKKETRIASDKMMKFLASLKKKYGGSKKTDSTVLKKITDECNAFLKTDDHRVSQQRIAINSKETGLKVRTKRL